MLEKLEVGKFAHLKEEFGKAEDDRLIRAKFIEDLLNGDIEGFQAHHRGIRISSAIINEPLDLQGAEVRVTCLACFLCFS